MPWVLVWSWFGSMSAWASPCAGPVVDSISGAQDAFGQSCGTTYDASSGFHFCEWVEDQTPQGWRCAELGSCDSCTGPYRETVEEARDAYATVCGEIWDPSSGFHTCEWTTPGWSCTGPGASTSLPDDDSDPNDPTDPVVPEPQPPTDVCEAATLAVAAPLAPAQPLYLHIDTNYELTWTQLDTPGVPVTGWNVFRGQDYVTTVNEPRYAIPASHRNATYAVTAINGVDQVHSHPSLFASRRPQPNPPVDAPALDAAPDFLDGPRPGPLDGNWRVIWEDDFNGSGLPNPSKWHFMEDPNHRDTAVQNREHAVQGDGFLKMDAIVNSDGRAEMSFLRTINSDNGINTGAGGDDFILDPTSGDLYVETSIRLDQAMDAYHAWWALWLFVNDIDANGVSYRAYNDDAPSGSEIDILEYAPDAAPNGFNAAVFIEHAGIPGGVTRPDGTVNDFSFPDLSPRGIKLTDGQFHKVGLLYTTSELQLFVDGQHFWTMDTLRFLTDQPRLGIQLTWEARDNPDGTGSFNPVPRYDECGQRRTFATGTLGSPTVYIDHVRVHRKVQRVELKSRPRKVPEKIPFRR